MEGQICEHCGQPSLETVFVRIGLETPSWYCFSCMTIRCHELDLTAQKAAESLKNLIAYTKRQSWVIDRLQEDKTEQLAQYTIQDCLPKPKRSKKKYGKVTK